MNSRSQHSSHSRSGVMNLKISSQALMTLPLCDTPRLSQLRQPVTTCVGVRRLCAAVYSCTIPPRIIKLVGTSCWGWGRGWVLTWQMEQAWAPSSAYGGQEESCLIKHMCTQTLTTQVSVVVLLLYINEWYCWFQSYFRLHGCVIMH